MIPFECTWPYDTMKNDIYVQECPFCDASNVILPLRKKDLPEIHDGKKKLLIFPCCYGRAVLVDADTDYLLADKPLRGQK